MHRMRLLLGDAEMLDAIEVIKTEHKGHKRKYDEAFEPPPALDAQLPVQTDANSALHEQTKTLTQEVQNANDETKTGAKSASHEQAETLTQADQNANDEASVVRVPSVAPLPPTPQPQPSIQVEDKTALDSENGAAAQTEPTLDEKPEEDEVVIVAETLRKTKEQILKEIEDDPSL